MPGVVPLLDLLGVKRSEDLDTITAWQQRPCDSRSLAVAIGRGAGGKPCFLDLHDGDRTHGPHGLVAGTTGSGKSELLQTLVALLAARYHPHDVAFVLVDYKGGAMAKPFAALPHLIGVITNLGGNLAQRALTALRSESQRRQRLFDRCGVSHIDAYQRASRRSSDLPPLPHLLLIVDEFRELKSEQPDFMRELVSLATVGRSLGLHLILATQQPAGVVDEHIWANTRFHICLRMARAEDSRAVLKRSDAAFLTVAGRGYLQVGEGSNQLFELVQAAYGGLPYAPGVVSSEPEEVIEIALDGGRRPLRAKTVASQAAGTQLQALVTHVCNVAQRAQIAPLPGPWLPPLPDMVAIADVRPATGWDGRGWRPVATWLEPVIGLLDEPAQQRQSAYRLPLAAGHLAIYGAPTTGKTTVLQTLVTSLVLDHPPSDLHLYLFDFGSRQLLQFAALPHVGAVLLPEEGERVHRTLRLLTQELERRKRRFAEAGVATLAALRAAVGEPTPAVVLLVDQVGTLCTAYPEAEEVLTRLAREGSSFGFHLVITAPAPGSIRFKLATVLTQAIALRLADRGDYLSAVGRLAGAEPVFVPGRALVKGTPPLELQVALPTTGDGEIERSAAVRSLVEAMQRNWTGARAPTPPEVPVLLTLRELLAAPLPPSSRFAVPVGLDLDNVEPALIDLDAGPHFLIAGPPESGKTTLLQSWLLALANAFGPDRLWLYLLDLRHAGMTGLARLPQVHGYATDEAQLAQALAAIGDALQERSAARHAAVQAAGDEFDEAGWLARQPAIVLAVDDFDAVRDQVAKPAKDRLDQLLRRERGLGWHVLLAGATADLASASQLNDAYVKTLKDLKCGVLLGSNDGMDLQLLGARPPAGSPGHALAPGQGYLVRHGRLLAFQAAVATEEQLRLRDWVARLQERWSPVTAGAPR